MEELHDRGAIEPRSRCDRAAIAPPSAWNRSGEFPTCSDGSRQSIHATIGSRSWPDRGAIVADRGEKMWLDCGVLEDKLKRNCSEIEATLPHEGIAPTTLQKTAITNATIAHDPRANFLFKTGVFSLLFF